MIEGYGTLSGTRSYANRFPEINQTGHFRKANDLFLSSVGLGTYLGEMDDATDGESHQAIVACLKSGINVIDSAINYRAQRSDRVVGRALRDLIRERELTRAEIFLATKGGFLP